MLAWIMTIFALVFATDPLRLSPIRGKNFAPAYGPPFRGKPDPCLVDTNDTLMMAAWLFKGELYGPESIAFDKFGHGPYASISDGRVLVWRGPQSGWETFSYSTNRSDYCDLPQPGPNLNHEAECGRPLGLHFHPINGNLYFCDAYFGLMSVNSSGGQAKVVTNQIDGVNFKFANDLAIDEDNDIIYFTDSSTKYYRREFFLESMEGGENGRLLKHDMLLNETAIVVDGLRFPNGVAISRDKSHLLVSETTQCRILRYWLKGPKSGSLETFIDLPGFPDNIRITERGTYWIAINARRNTFLDWLRSHPLVRELILRLPLPLYIIYGLLIRLPHGLAIEVDDRGGVLRVLEDRRGKVVKSLSEVNEHAGTLYMGSIMASYIAALNLSQVQASR